MEDFWAVNHWQTKKTLPPLFEKKRFGCVGSVVIFVFVCAAVILSFVFTLVVAVAVAFAFRAAAGPWMFHLLIGVNNRLE